MRLADYVMRFLVQHGVRHLFLLPGGGAMHLADAAGLCPGLEYVANLHEQASVIAAEYYARVTENLGAALVTTGPGGTNALTGVAGAWIESVPLMVISGQVKRADLKGGRGVRQMGVQEADVVAMAAPVTKYAVTVLDPAEIRHHLEKGLHLATSGRKGPVWIDIPLDVQASQVDPDALRPFLPDPVVPAPDLARLDTVARLLAASTRPLVLAGHGVRLAGAAQVFRQWCEAWRLPVVATWNAADLLPHDHPLWVGKPGVVAARGANFAVQNCDLLLAIGCRLDHILTAFAPRQFARGARKVVIDADPAELAKLDMAVDLPLALDAGEALRGLAALPVPAGERQAWLGRCQAWKERYALHLDHPAGEPGPVSHYHFADLLAEEMPAGTLIVTGSSGLAVEVLHTVFRMKEGQRILLTAGLGAMGYGLPAAIGACVAGGGKPMVAIESDGSLQLNVQELATIRALDLPIRLFILNNGGYASIRATQRNYFAGRFVGTGPEAKLALPDVLKVAEAYGIAAVRAEDPALLRQTVREVLAHPGPIVCDIPLRPDETLWPKAAAIPQADGSMISMPLEDMTPLLSLEELRENMIVPVREASLRAREGA